LTSRVVYKAVVTGPQSFSFHNFSTRCRTGLLLRMFDRPLNSLQTCMSAVNTLSSTFDFSLPTFE
ncbi:hypothetical protein RvY_16310, partial [Ramazzottius varieornatus]